MATFAELYGFFGYLTAYGPHLSVIHSMFRLYEYEEWTHCALVPFMVGFLVWHKRRELATTPVRPSLLGLIPCVFGFVFFWVSYRLDDVYFAFISIQTLTFGAIVFFLGWRWMRALMFPWLFLVFAWPLFFLDNLIAFPLRMVMSNLSTAMLNLVGMNAVQVGTAIQSAADPQLGVPMGRAFQVDVADPCSGMRSLFALIMVSALYGFFTMQSWWKHLLLVAAAVPLAIIGNLARILMLTIGILVFGDTIAIGTLDKPSFFHMFSGFFVFIVALGGMLFIAAILEGSPQKWLIRRFSSGKSASTPRRQTRKTNASPRDVDDLY